MQFPAGAAQRPKLRAEGVMSGFIQDSGIQMGLALEPHLVVWGGLAQIFNCACARVGLPHAIKAPVHPYTCRRPVSSDCLTPARLPEPGGQGPDLASDG